MVGNARDRNIEEVRAQFIELIRTEFRTMIIASTFFTVIGLVLWIPGMLLIVAFGVTSGSLRQLARRPAARGDMFTAVAIFACGLWASTIFITALLPLALPVMVFNVVVPVVLAATYLDDRQHWPIALTGVAVAGIIGVLALTQDGLRMQEGVDEWIVDWVTIGFLVGYMWMFTATVRDANRTRIATLERALLANDDLLEAQSELRRSRRRLVEVADAERGRIERNIHDGAQQRLVSMAVQLKLAAQLAERGTPTSTETLELLHGEATVALTELRELAQGIYPSLLAERGLVEAVGSLCRRSTIPARAAGSVSVELADQVQAALYFFCAEAIQNANKHAGPDAELTVDIAESDGTVIVEVADTGTGFDVDRVSRSRGLLNMADRVEALDGVFEIESAAGNGTTLRATVPVETPLVAGLDGVAA